MIELINLRAQHTALAAELEQALRTTLDESELILGGQLRQFEAEFAAYCGVREAVGVGSGLAALHFALRAAGVGPGDEVITAAHTYAATVLAIVHAGAEPVLVDADPATMNICPSGLEAAVTSRTKAILPIHLYGRLVEMEPIRDMARRHGLTVIEDAAQAHGAVDEAGRRAGSLATAGCFSFYPTKNLGALGDGGMVTTDDVELAERVRVLRNYGQSRKYHFQCAGYNERLDTLQAAMLRVKLPHLDRWNAERRAHAARYDRQLADLPLVLPQPAGKGHVYHLYVVRTPRRDALAAHLGQRGVLTGVHYPVPVHQQAAFSSWPFARRSFPVAESLAQEVLSLPMYPELPDAHVDAVVQAIGDFFADSAAAESESCRSANRTAGKVC